MAASEAFPVYNKTHLVALEMPDRSGNVIITKLGEIDEDNYFDPRTAQVATVDHVQQVGFHSVFEDDGEEYEHTEGGYFSRYDVAVLSFSIIIVNGVYSESGEKKKHGVY
ncbi:putative F-actin-capping protein subunit alpha [Dioscorea sansibarensis]